MLPLVQVPTSSIGRLICLPGIYLGYLSGVCDAFAWCQDAQFPADVISGKISIVDLAGAPRNELKTALSAPFFNRTYLVTPVPMYLMLPQDISSCMALKERIFRHLDMDHIPESIRAGWYDGLSLGIYVVDWGCIGNAGTKVT